MDKPLSPGKDQNTESQQLHVCKNCSSEIEGNYCHFCGQRYHEHKESFGELVYEFIADFIHFDSRFFKTVLPLIFAPGRLTIKYNAGMQRSQFHPIRLYIFSSFVYFFFFFAYNNFEKKIDSMSPSTELKLGALGDSIGTSLNTHLLADSALVKARAIENQATGSKGQLTAPDGSNLHYGLTVSHNIDSMVKKKVTREEYLARQKALPKAKRDNLLKRTLTAKILDISSKGEYGMKEFIKNLVSGFMHNLPKMLFFLLPVFAFILKLLYIRHKEYYYVDHAILSLHYFSFIFLLLTLSNFILDKIFGTSIFGNIAGIWILLYLLIAMKKIYRQGWGKTIMKYLALGFIFFFTVVLVLFFNLIFSTLKA